MDIPLAPARVLVDRRADGSLLVRSPHPLGAPARHVCDRLRHWSEAAPDRAFLAERAGGGPFRRVTYGEARAMVDRLAQALLERGVSEARPLMILSENGIDHALLTLAAMQIGAPAAPISPAYSLLSRDFGKLAAIFEILSPGLVYAADGERYGRALSALGVDPGLVVTSLSIDALLSTSPRPEMEERFLSLGPEAIAKVLFTSGSTGQPKGVINTQRMLCSNQQAIAALWPFLSRRPPIVLDWLPWSHTFGANHNFNMVLFHGGSLYIDDGKPTPELIERTARNLREVSPTMYFNVPRGYDMLLPYLEREEAVREAFFRDLDLIFYAAASLPGSLWERLEAASIKARGERVLMLSAWGSTETAPMSTAVHFRIQRAGVIGLPAPGTEIKLSPMFGKYELRVKGPNVTPGYWKRPDLTASAFDDEGFFRMGDAGKLQNPEAPEEGIVFDGRIAEDFKLSSGTWVHVGALRTQVVAAAAPLLSDAVLAGLDQEEIGLLLLLNPIAAKGLSKEDVQARLEAAFAGHNRENPMSSHRVGRFLILTEPLSIDADEITDKGYINQRAVLARRAGLVERLYSDGDPEVTVMR